MRIQRQSLTNHCIVLDLDETCIHTVEGYDKLNKSKLLKDTKYFHVSDRIYKFDLIDVVTTVGKGEITEMWGVKRPGLDKFIEFCCSYFKCVCIWSAGRFRYVHGITDKVIFKHSPHKPDVVFTFNDCETYKGLYIKRLSKLFSTNIANGQLKPSNTFIVDDRATTFCLNPGNGILIPEYNPHPLHDKDTVDPDTILNDQDNALELLQAWFMKPSVSNCQDVRTLDKERIFSRYNKNIK